MNLNEWAIKWSIPFEAVEDLRAQFGMMNTDSVMIDGESEAAVQVRVRLEASRAGGRLWRNNVGACYDENGRFIRYGLANESKAMNKILKSSDLIGILPVRIEVSHIGKIFGQFLARENKPAGWQYTGTKREIAQLKFLQLIVSLGGDATFATGEGTIC